MRLLMLFPFLALIGCASGTAGTGVIDGRAVSVEITEALNPSGLTVGGYELEIDGESIGVMECTPSCSTLVSGSDIVEMIPLETARGTYSMRRIYRANSIFFEIFLNEDFVGNVRFI